MNQELREAVARAIHYKRGDNEPWDGLCEDCERSADAAIAVATPIIEAALIERLMADAWDQALVRRIPIPGTYLVEEGQDLDDWLRAYLDQ